MFHFTGEDFIARCRCESLPMMTHRLLKFSSFNLKITFYSKFWLYLFLFKINVPLSKILVIVYESFASLVITESKCVFRHRLVQRI